MDESFNDRMHSFQIRSIVPKDVTKCGGSISHMRVVTEERTNLLGGGALDDLSYDLRSPNRYAEPSTITPMYENINRTPTMAGMRPSAMRTGSMVGMHAASAPSMRVAAPSSIDSILPVSTATGGNNLPSSAPPASDTLMPNIDLPEEVKDTFYGGRRQHYVSSKAPKSRNKRK